MTLIYRQNYTLRKIFYYGKILPFPLYHLLAKKEGESCMTNKLETLYQEAILVTQQCNIPIGKITSVSRNSRLTRTWGRCSRNKDGSFSIDIAGRLLDEGSDKGILETILHEMIHTCKGCFNHKNTWKKYADRLNTKYGFNIQRTDTALNKGVANEPKRIYKYAIRCPQCGTNFKYQIMTNAVKNPSLYMCRDCKCRLERVL